MRLPLLSVPMTLAEWREHDAEGHPMKGDSWHCAVCGAPLIWVESKKTYESAWYFFVPTERSGDV